MRRSTSSSKVIPAMKSAAIRFCEPVKAIDRDLAMVPQVQPCPIADEETYWQHLLNIDPQRGQFAYQTGQGGTRAQRVHEHSARHAALGRPP